MSGRRMKALRRAAYGDLVTKGDAREYDAPQRAVLGKVIARIGKRAAELIGYRRIRLIGTDGVRPAQTIRVKGAADRAYREAKKALRRRRLGGRLPA